MGVTGLPAAHGRTSAPPPPPPPLLLKQVGHVAADIIRVPRAVPVWQAVPGDAVITGARRRYCRCRTGLLGPGGGGAVARRRRQMLLPPPEQCPSSRVPPKAFHVGRVEAAHGCRHTGRPGQGRGVGGCAWLTASTWQATSGWLRHPCSQACNEGCVWEGGDEVARGASTCRPQGSLPAHQGPSHLPPPAPPPAPPPLGFPAPAAPR